MAQLCLGCGHSMEEYVAAHLRPPGWPPWTGGGRAVTGWCGVPHAGVCPICPSLIAGGDPEGLSCRPLGASGPGLCCGLLVVTVAGIWRPGQPLRGCGLAFWVACSRAGAFGVWLFTDSSFRRSHRCHSRRSVSRLRCMPGPSGGQRRYPSQSVRGQRHLRSAIVQAACHQRAGQGQGSWPRGGPLLPVLRYASNWEGHVLRL